MANPLDGLFGGLKKIVDVTGVDPVEHQLNETLEIDGNVVVEPGSEEGIVKLTLSGSDGAPGAQGPAGTLSNLSVRVAIDSQVTLSGAPGTKDGVALVNGDDVLCFGQTVPSQNGIYTVNTTGAWSRRADYDSSAELDLRQFTLVREGTIYRGKFFYPTNQGTLTLGTTALAYTYDMKAPAAGTNTDGDFGSYDAPGKDLSWGPLTIVAGGVTSLFRRTKKLIFGSAVPSVRSAFTQATDALGHLRLTRGDEACVTDYPYCAHPSTTSATCTGTGSTPNIVLNTAADFAERDGVVVWFGGADYTFPASLPAPAATVNGTTGANTVSYKLVAMTEDCAASPATAAVTVNVPDELQTALVFNPAEGYDSRVTFCSTANIANLNDVGPFVDGVELQSGMYCLLKDQTDPIQNGYYQVVISAAGLYQLTRFTPTNPKQTLIYNGTVNMGKRFRTATPTAVVDTDPQTFQELYVKVRAPVTDVTVATTANISLTGTQTIDGVTLTNGVSTVLVKNQTTTSQNGIYLYNSGGAWTRVTAFDSAAEHALGACIRVTRGTVNTRTIWMITTAPTTLGTDPIVFTSKPIVRWVVYKAYNAGAYAFAGDFLANPLMSSTVALFDCYWTDYGFTNPTKPHWLPTTPPATSARGFLRARISAIAGTSVTLDQNLGASVAAVRIDHDNYQAFVDAFAAHGRVTIPEGTYRIAGNLQNDGLRYLSGAGRENTILNFAPGFGFRHGPSGAGSGSLFEDFQISTDSRSLCAGTLYVSPDTINRKFHGAAFLVQTRCHTKRVRIGSFMGSAFVLRGADVDGTNANVTTYDDCYAANIWGHCFVANGSEANSLTWSRCSGTTSQGGGFYDTGFLSNQFFGCHTSANLGPAYWTEDGGASIWTGCYSESGQPRSIVGVNTTIRGGSHGAGFLNTGVGDIGTGTFKNSQETHGGWPEMVWRVFSGTTASGGADIIGRLTSTGIANGGLDWTLYRRPDEYTTGYADVVRMIFDSTFVGTAFDLIGRFKYGVGKLNFPGGFFLEESPSAGNTKRRRIHICSGTTFINGVYRAGDWIVNASGATTAPSDAATVPLRYVVTTFGNGSARANSTAYTVGNCMASGGFAYVCTVKGTSAASLGALTTTTGNTSTDGTVTWECVGTDTPVEGTHWIAPGSKIEVLDTARAVGAVGANAIVSYNVTVTGARAALHRPYAFPKAALGTRHWSYTCEITANDTVTVIFHGDSAGGTPNAVDWIVGVERG